MTIKSLNKKGRDHGVQSKKDMSFLKTFLSNPFLSAHLTSSVVLMCTSSAMKLNIIMSMNRAEPVFKVLYILPVFSFGEAKLQKIRNNKCSRIGIGYYWIKKSVGMQPITG